MNVDEDNTARDSIHASEKSLGKVFCDDYAFHIPSYQRPYAWTPSHAGQLLDDLIAALTDADPTTATPYFLGSIVLIKHPDRRDADVVDGQQRLTTLTILFAVLRNLSEANNERRLQEFICQEGNPFTGTSDQFRLMLRSRDAEFFEKFVQNAVSSRLDPPTSFQSDSQRLIIENFQYFRTQLSKFSEEQRVKLTTFMVQRCFLVLVEASNRKYACRIFSVMNDRGLDLSPTDILKADIIGALPEKLRDEYTNRWEDIQQFLGRQNFENLFGHIRMIFRRQKL